MPLRRKKRFNFRTILVITTIVILLILMIVYFAPTQNITEVVLA